MSITVKELAQKLEAHEAFCEQITKQREKDHQYIKQSLEKFSKKSDSNEASISQIKVSLASMEATQRTTAKFMYVIGSGLFTGVVGILVMLITRGLG